MTEVNLMVLECPACGNKQQVKVWSSVNITLNPELKEKVMNYEINQFNCDACANTAFINTPLLYHDMDRKYCVQYYPLESLTNPEFLESFSRDGSLIKDQPLEKIKISPLLAASEYLFKPHIVFDIQELVHYVMFRDICENLADTRRELGLDE
jgi:hypothetical protein